MSLVWDTVIPFSKKIISRFDVYDKQETKYHINNENFIWGNYIFTSKTFRRAHIEIVDAREYKKIWVMHMTIFPYFNDPSPIFGFDIVCGANKITGAFHDFSKMGESFIYEHFQSSMQKYDWEKRRELPDWARQIFSPAMLAISNINSTKELDQLIELTVDNLEYYLYNVGMSSEHYYITEYNNYCKFQKQNKHTPTMMESIGVDSKIFRQFMDDTLFPEHYGTHSNNRWTSNN